MSTEPLRLASGESTDLSTFIKCLVAAEQTVDVTEFVTADGALVKWTWHAAGGDDPGHDHFEISKQGSPLGAEDMHNGLDPAALDRIAALLAPGSKPEEITGTVS